MRKTTKFFLLNLVISIAGLAAPELARGQFLGYVSPQTVVQTLASTVSCTGVAQVFITANLGQNQHAATISGNNARQLQMEIQGVDGSGNVTRISDVLDNAQLAPTPQTITGNGYFPIVRVKVLCSGAGSNFTVTYAGTSSTNPQPVGGYQVSQIDKAMFLGLPANATQTDNFQPPFGSTAGFIFFQYNTAGVSGSTIVINCAGNLLTNFSVTFNLANSIATVQTFQVPANPCTALTLTYASGGATAGTITAEYIFYVPGTQTTLSTPNSGTSSTLPIQVVSDSLSQGFATTGFTATNPANGLLLIHVGANNGSRSVYYNSINLSCSTACSVLINTTTNNGTTCVLASGVNLKLGSAVTASAIVQVGSCVGANPTVGTNVYNSLAIAAGQNVTLDLRGFIAPAGTTRGIDVVAVNFTGSINGYVTWYEE